MNNEPHMPGIDTGMNNQAVSLYGQTDAMDDFPVLKGFQQYIDSEQAKARKRLISLGIFFGILMGAVVAVFLVMLMKISERNQTLNDRLVEFAMKERTQQSPVVVQPPVQQDNSAILSLTSKLEEMQKQLVESQKKAEAAERARQAADKAAEEALKPKPPSPQELEIQNLKAQLNAEKEKLAAEKAKQKEAELEAYRRKHYPELYAPKPVVVKTPPKKTPVVIDEDDDDDIPAGRITPLQKRKAIRYFDDDDDDLDEEEDVKKPAVAPKESKKQELKKKEEPVQITEHPAPPSKPEVKRYSIPVDVKGKSSSWRLP